MNEALLEAARALSLSPRKDRSQAYSFPASPASTRPFDTRGKLPLSISKLQNEASIPTHAACELGKRLYQAASSRGSNARPSLSASLTKMPRGVYSAASNVIASPSANISTMPRGVKRPRAPAAETSGTVEETITTATPHSPRQSDRAGINAQEPIVISDDDDENGVPDAFAPSVELRSLADAFAYRSPNKAPSRKKARSSISMQEKSEPTSDPTLSPMRSDDAGLHLRAADSGPIASTSASKETSSPSKKESQPSKANFRTTIQPKKTIERAKQAGVSALDLSELTPAAVRLLGRCSFCAGAFAKSAAAKTKKQHLALCAPLQSITSRASALGTIASDIRSAIERNEAAKREARANQTVFQDLVKDADVVLHEGRASQIEASPKKRGKDSVVIKKTIQRSKKPALLFSTSDGVIERDGALSTATSRLLPPRQAVVAARDLAGQLFGGEIEASGRDADTEPKPAIWEPVVESPVTPDRRRQTPNEDYDLPLVSAEQMFATLAHTSPKTSPFKALQLSRERQASRDKELPSTQTRSQSVSTSPCPAPTQQFGPSKLAERRRVQDSTQKPSLFEAKASPRSLLDLMPGHCKSVDESHSETKRKASQLELSASITVTKKSRPSETEEAALPLVTSPGSNVADMDVDEALDEGQPSHKLVAGDWIKAGKLQDQESASNAQASASLLYTTDTGEPPHNNALQPGTSSFPDRPTHSDGITGEHTLAEGNDDKNGEDKDGQEENDDQGAVEGDTSEAVGSVSGDSLHIDDIRADRLRHSEEVDDDDDDDAQSFLELLEPLDPSELHRAVSPFMARRLSSASSSDDLASMGTLESSLKRRRMLVASGGSSVGFADRRGRGSSGRLVPSSDPMQDRMDAASPHHQATRGSVTDSEPDFQAVTDHSSASTPQL